MLFQASLTIPANTASTSPTTETFNIAKGIITKFMVRPRPGHAGLAHLVILHHEHQVAPSTEGMDFHGDTFPIDWEEYYESYEPPYQLKLKGWNEDTSYEHTFDVYVEIQPRKAVLALALVDTITAFLGRLLPRRVAPGGL